MPLLEVSGLRLFQLEGVEKCTTRTGRRLIVICEQTKLPAPDTSDKVTEVSAKVKVHQRSVTIKKVQTPLFGNQPVHAFKVTANPARERMRCRIEPFVYIRLQFVAFA
jgi:hypothetical protein